MIASDLALEVESRGGTELLLSYREKFKQQESQKGEQATRSDSLSHCNYTCTGILSITNSCAGWFCC